MAVIPMPPGWNALRFLASRCAIPCGVENIKPIASDTCGKALSSPFMPWYPVPLWKTWYGVRHGWLHKHAVTGLGAAWLYSHFAAFRTVSIYLAEWPDNKLLEQIGFRQTDSGANVWLVIPKDPDVFHAVQPVADIPCVHRIQTWLDLKFHPERAEEAAAELRTTLEL